MLITRIATLLLLVSACSPAPPTTPGMGTPPVAAQKPFKVESPHGTRVDEYYWLRDDTRQSEEVLAHLNAENAWRDAAMAHTAPLQQQLYEELVGRLDPDDSSVPVLDHGYWYYTRFEPGMEYPLYGRRKGSMDAPEQLMLDGNRMATGRAYFRIGATEVSPDGKLLAWTEDTVGRQQYTLKVKDLETGITLPDSVANIEAGFIWTGDSGTLLYIAKNPVTLLSERVFRHALGTASAADALLYEETDDSFYLGLSKSRSEQYLFIQFSSTESSEWRYADTNDPRLDFRPVLPREPHILYDVEHLGPDFILRTNHEAPNFRIVKTPIESSADKRSWRDVLPHRPDTLLEDFEVAAKHLIVNERSGGLLKVRVRRYGLPSRRFVDSSSIALRF
jgi:oligopeptidase B